MTHINSQVSYVNTANAKHVTSDEQAKTTETKVTRNARALVKDISSKVSKFFFRTTSCTCKTIIPLNFSVMTNERYLNLETAKAPPVAKISVAPVEIASVEDVQQTAPTSDTVLLEIVEIPALKKEAPPKPPRQKRVTFGAVTMMEKPALSPAEEKPVVSKRSISSRLRSSTQPSMRLWMNQLLTGSKTIAPDVQLTAYKKLNVD